MVFKYFWKLDIKGTKFHVLTLLVHILTWGGGSFYSLHESYVHKKPMKNKAKKETPTQILSREICKIFKSRYTFYKNQ